MLKLCLAGIDSAIACNLQNNFTGDARKDVGFQSWSNEAIVVYEKYVGGRSFSKMAIAVEH